MGQVLVLPVPRGCRGDADTVSWPQGHRVTAVLARQEAQAGLYWDCSAGKNLSLESSDLKEVTPCLSLFPYRFIISDLPFLHDFVWLILTVLVCSAYLPLLGICCKKT